jgi:hypothetical protein
VALSSNACSFCLRPHPSFFLLLLLLLPCLHLLLLLLLVPSRHLLLLFLRALLPDLCCLHLLLRL